MTTFNYDSWIKEQADAIVSEMRQRAMAGRIDGAIYVTPSNGAIPGKLTLADESPQGATDCLTFPVHGSRVGHIPYSSMASVLWNACRRMPICPIA